ISAGILQVFSTTHGQSQQEISGSPSGLPLQRHWERVSFPLENGYGRNPGRGRGLNRRAFLTGGVSNRSWFYDEQEVLIPDY
ncbi:MAG: hypothetical protein LBF51_04215, partial [Zoogloeaceae bacterium]|nr:hypothetical protein [Zoogloeaceae bacterium]